MIAGNSSRKHFSICALNEFYIPAILHTISCRSGIFLYCSTLAQGGRIMSALSLPAPPDHIEGAHPLLGGEIRFLLFWLAPTSPGVHFTTTSCYCTGLFTRLDCTTLQLSVSLSLSPVWLVALKAGHQVEPTSVSQPETWCLQ